MSRRRDSVTTESRGGVAASLVARLAGLTPLGPASAAVILGPYQADELPLAVAPWNPCDPPPIALIGPRQQRALTEETWRRAPATLAVFCDGLTPPPWWPEAAHALLSAHSPAETAARLRRLAPLLARWRDHHATLVAVAGCGLLLSGGPERGKSELALALVERGHRLVADDRVVLAALDPRFLLGWAPRAGYGKLHLRDLGVVDLLAWQGRRALARVQPIHAMIRLQPATEPAARLVPEIEHVTMAGVALPRYHVHGPGGRALVPLLEALAEGLRAENERPWEELD